MIPNKITRRENDVTIVGFGVSGGAAGYNFARYTNVKKMATFEKYSWVAMVNSNPLFNAQTSHDGSTETNYSLAHALQKVQPGAKYLRNYVDSKGPDPTLFRVVKRMVFGADDKVELLEKRFKQFSPYYPDIYLANAKEIGKLEPNIMLGRNPRQEVRAIVSNQGYMIDYQRYTEELFKDTIRVNSEFDYAFNTPVQSIEEKEDHYELKTPLGIFYSKVVIFEAGPYSLYFARRLGYGMQYGILNVAGSFYYTEKNLLNNKVYQPQIEGRPFAATHGDPDIVDPRITRFGPTTKPIPLMERYHYETMPDFMRLPLFSTPHGIYTVLSILRKNKLFGYAARNIVYDLPIIGPRAFAEEIRPIIPTINHRDLKLRRGAGGTRPQIVNLKTGQLEFGDSNIVGKNVIFNTTPSPGASVSMANGHRDAKKSVEFLGDGYWFDEEKFQKELGRKRE